MLNTILYNTLLQLPVPKDINLPLPLPEWLLVIILIVSFLLHILFINLMIGGSLLTFWYELKGIKDKDADKLAREIANTITVNKSLAVVLGVAPLLSINVLYTIYFYSANALTGYMWISVVPWVAVAFLVVYLHKYTWDKLADNKILHLSILSLGVGSFLVIPFIFLTNINLMLFPEKWGEIQGFLSALSLPNVFPRYFHFITASMAITGIFLTAYFGRKNYIFEGKFSVLTKSEVKKKMLNLAFIATGAQFIFGPLLFLTLPTKGITWNLFWIILGGVSVACIVLFQLWKLINSPGENFGKRLYTIIGMFVLIVLFMGTGRHFYREAALKTHRELVAAHTTQHWEMVEKAHKDLLNPSKLKIETEVSPGKQLFSSHCAVCHSPTIRLVGPPMAEVVPTYENNIDALKAWIKAPGRKRMDYPQMTGFPQLSDEQLTTLSNYLVQEAWK